MNFIYVIWGIEKQRGVILMSEIVFDSSETKNILMSANAFHTLKNNLFNNIGSYKTKGFLFRFGKEFRDGISKK